MTARRHALLALASVLAPSVATACPCGLSLGPMTPWTRPDDRVAIAGTLSFIPELGTMDAQGRAYSNPAGTATTRLVLDVAAGWRPIPSLEIAAMWSAGYTWNTLPAGDSNMAEAGDASVRVRWEAPVPLRRAIPQVAAWAALRMPTGYATATPSATITGLGLGSWEPALGAELRWHATDTLTLSFVADAGIRAGSFLAVQPGPRLTVAAVISHLFSRRFGWVASAVQSWEWDASRGGNTVADSGTRRLTLTAGATAQLADHWRAVASVGGDVPIDGFGANIILRLRAGVTVIWSR